MRFFSLIYLITMTGMSSVYSSPVVTIVQESGKKDSWEIKNCINFFGKNNLNFLSLSSNSENKIEKYKTLLERFFLKNCAGKKNTKVPTTSGNTDSNENRKTLDINRNKIIPDDTILPGMWASEECTDVSDEEGKWSVTTTFRFSETVAYVGIDTIYIHFFEGQDDCSGEVSSNMRSIGAKFKIGDTNEKGARPMDTIYVDPWTGKEESHFYSSIKIVQKDKKLVLRYARNSEGKDGSANEKRRTEFTDDKYYLVKKSDSDCYHCK